MSMKVVRFYTLTGGFRELLVSSGVSALVTSEAASVLAAAQADPHDDTFEYQNSLHIETDVSPGTKGALPRARARVVAGDPKSHVVEARFGVLARALDAAG